MTAKRAAVFDLDGTLLPGTSAERLFLPYLARRGVLGARQLIPAVAVALALPLKGRGAALRRNKRYLAGLDPVLIRELGAEFVRDVLSERLCPSLTKRIAELKRTGYLVCLLSGTPDVLASAVATRLKMADAIGTGLCVRRGRYSGRIAGTHYFAEAKVRGVDTLVRRHGIALEQSYAFADHVTDIAFLARFGRPVAVNPDAGLRREAGRRSWPVLESGDTADKDITASTHHGPRTQQATPPGSR